MNQQLDKGSLCAFNGARVAVTAGVLAASMGVTPALAEETTANGTATEEAPAVQTSSTKTPAAQHHP